MLIHGSVQNQIHLILVRCSNTKENLSPKVQIKINYKFSKSKTASKGKYLREVITLNVRSPGEPKLKNNNSFTIAIMNMRYPHLPFTRIKNIESYIWICQRLIVVSTNAQITYPLARSILSLSPRGSNS